MLHTRPHLRAHALLYVLCCSGSDHDDDDAGDGGDAGDGPPPDRRAVHDTTSAKLLRQWLAAALQSYDYISVSAVGEDGGALLVFAQILAVAPRNLFVKAWCAEEQDTEQGLFNVDATVFEAWSPKFKDPAVAGASFDVFPFAEPSTIDILGLVGADIGSRHSFFRWKSRLSYVEGCTCLYAAEPLKPLMSLMHGKIPVLCLLDELEFLGYTKQSSIMHHSSESALILDERHSFSKRMYFKCVLCHDALIRAAAGEFHSNHSAKWFELLLRTKKPVPADDNAKTCQRKLAMLAGDLGALALLDGQAARAPVMADLPRAALLDVVPRAALLDVVPGSASDEEVAGDVAMIDVPLVDEEE